MKVIDISRGVAGAYCGQMLALTGAEVVAVALCHPALPAGDAADQIVWEYVNRGKTALAFNLSRGAEMTRLMELIEGADALIEDLGPRGLDVAGLAEARLRERNPRLVLTRISEFGQTGPWAGWAGSELVNLAAGGLLFLTGTWDRPPVQLAPYQAQLTAGLLAAVATMAARYGGEPVTVDLSKQESVLALITPALSEYAYNGTIPAREGTVSAMTRIERSADGWVYAGPGALNTADYRRFSELLEVPELAEERFATAEGRMEHWAEHQALVRPRLAERTTEEWLERAAAARLTFGPVQTAPEVLASDVLAERGFFADLTTSEGVARAPLAPYLVDGARPAALAEPLKPRPRIAERRHTASRAHAEERQWTCLN